MTVILFVIDRCQMRFITQGISISLIILVVLLTTGRCKVVLVTTVGTVLD